MRPEDAIGMRAARAGEVYQLAGFSAEGEPLWARVVRGRALRRAYPLPEGRRLVAERLRPPTIGWGEAAEAPQIGC